MKNKGFTLIELLVVVAIMGVLGVIISVSLTKTLKNSNQMGCDRFVNEIEEAACVYVGLSKNEGKCFGYSCTINVNDLLEEGLIHSEVDACTGNPVENLTANVSVSLVNGEKKCTYNGVREYAEWDFRLSKKRR